MNKTKICSKCGVEKLASEFYKQARSNDSLQGLCKLCSAESNKEYSARKKQEISKRKSDRYYINKDLILSRNKKYRDSNKEKLSEKAKTRYQKNKNRILSRQKELRLLIPEVFKEKDKRYRVENKEKIREKVNHDIETLHDSYVKILVRKQTNCPTPHPELVKLKRVQIQIKRYLKENSV